VSERHPVEVLLNASASDILSAVQRGFRALVDVKGKLAEYFLEKQLADLVLNGQIESFQWTDVDGEPDFEVRVHGRSLKLECKNIRSKEMFRKPTLAYKVEIQKTRNSRDGTPTRGYRQDEFDVLAACLFNHTKKWEYLFVATENLARRVDMPDLLVVMQRVPLRPEGHWNHSLWEVLSAVAGSQDT
jgi:hypothetical protein